MTKVIRLKKGLNIPLSGKPEKNWINSETAKEVAICPDDFIGIVPKPLLKEGERVKAGEPIFYHKDKPEILVVSPVSGTLKAIKRGLKRKIEAFILETDFDVEYSDKFSSINVNLLSSDDVKNFLLQSGLWVYLRQRPYNIVAMPDSTPKAIFISAFDTAPLAPDLEIILKDDEDYIQQAIYLLKRLVNVPIYVGVKEGVSSIFERIKGVEIRYFSGPHPAGNVGIQIHHIDPINKGEIVWTIRPEDLVVMGKYVIHKKYDLSRTIAITGSQLKQTGYVKTIQGAQVSSFISSENIIGNNNRFISGNVLTGKKIELNGYLGFFDRMISVIPEGNQYEFLGWAMPGFNKFSVSRTFFSWLMPKKEYIINTNYHGGERAFVITGQYEQVVPMDILPQHLVKAAITKNIDMMEKLGIYEVVEEDLALCEFVCTSKIEVQKIIREALDYIRAEMS
jgi:Na+-transporting NADH:ubiquinone oxidoreductase subunit A